MKSICLSNISQPPVVWFIGSFNFGHFRTFEKNLFATKFINFYSLFDKFISLLRFHSVKVRVHREFTRYKLSENSIVFENIQELLLLTGLKTTVKGTSAERDSLFFLDFKISKSHGDL